MSTEPFLDFYGKEEELDKFLRDLGMSGEEDVDELSEEETRKLANAIVIRLLRQGAYEGIIEEFVGKKFILKNELIKNAVTFTDVINSCGRAAACSVGFAICVKDDKYLEKGYKIWRNFQIELLEEINKRRKEVKEGKCIRYIIMENAPSTGPVATVLSRYLFSDKPFIAVNVKNGTAKVSSRANRRIKVDLGEVMRIAAGKVGGRGGGHSVAAGAVIPPENVEDFISEVDKICCSMLNSS
jgi:alanyl-tRNA synthetase